MKRIFSGVQPTGDLHLGNYLGAIKQFVELQDQEDAERLFCVVDMHAITVKHDPRKLAAQTREIAAAYIACGIDHSKSIIFAQSHVPAHAEMAWMLNCVARMGWMERMVQFKDKAGADKERASVGLFTYPVLMAADILAYQATHVPVGDDQKQHLNLARDIAEKFNHDYGALFPVPIAMHSAEGARIMSLQDGTAKMSKSDPDPASRINLSDSNDVINKKIRRATAHTLPFPADSNDLSSIEPDLNAASVANMINLYVALTGVSRDRVFDDFGGKGYGVFKPALANAVIATVEPIRTKMAELLTDDAAMQAVLASGASRARELAAPVVRKTKELMGFEVSF